MTEEKGTNVILCGFMATGKSSVGRKLAELMGYDFLDMDAAIEAEQGTSIPQIFAARGEAAFRALESEMVERIARLNRQVVATGGGTIVNPLNLEKLRNCGIIINLAADIDTILARAGTGEDRPMLKSEDRRERVRTLMEQRAPAYAQADMTVDTTSLSIDDVARFIFEKLKDSKTRRL